MLIREWEIWHTFASYFSDPIHDLEKAAQNLVKSELLRCAFLDNGNYYWLENSKLLNGHAEITLGANRSAAWIDIKPPTPDEFEREVLLDSCYFRFVELQNFARAKNFPPKYVRGHVGECLLISKDYTYNVYPIIKLYETGVILIEMRIFSSEMMGLERLIEEYVNLYKRSFDNALVPPGLRYAAQHAFALTEKPKSSLLLRIGSYWLDREIQNNISKTAFRERSGDFEFQYMPLWDLDVLDKEKKDSTKNKDANFNVYTIYELASDIFHAVSITVPGLRRGKSLLWKPNTPLNVGNFWSGRPHIHLLKFQGQASTAQQNDTKFQNEFGWIMAGSFEKNSKLGKQFLPKNGRLFSDYGAYVAEQGTLWAWGRRGLSEKTYKDTPKNAGLVFPNQTACEMLEYGHMLHRRMLESVATLKSPETALRERENLVELENAISNVSGYGEIRDLLSQGWHAMGVNKLQTAISDLIAIRHTETSAKEGRRLSALQTVLSLIFGVLAIPTFATGVVKPLWNWLSLWRPDNQDAAEVWFFVIALIVIEVPILYITRSILRNRS